MSRTLTKNDIKREWLKLAIAYHEAMMAKHDYKRLKAHAKLGKYHV